MLKSVNHHRHATDISTEVAPISSEPDYFDSIPMGIREANIRLKMLTTIGARLTLDRGRSDQL